MFLEKENYFYIEEFENYKIRAIYTKKNAGNMSDYCNIEGQKEKIQFENRKKILKEINLEDKKIVMSYQTHTNNVENIDENNEIYTFKDVDGFITKRKDVALFTFYADCLPIFVYDKKNEVIGVWHSGWTGTFKEIMKYGLDKMYEKYKTDKKDVLMALGIGISQENYEVGEEFYNKFCDKFKEDSNLIKESFLFDEKIKKYKFDNTKFNEIMALSLGIKKENLIISNENTWNEKFHSHRRENKNSGRAAAIISFLK